MIDILTSQITEHYLVWLDMVEKQVPLTTLWRKILTT